MNGFCADAPGTGTALMLVSARVGPELRRQVAAGERPCPEFLKLEEAHGVKLLDWTAVGSKDTRRSAGLSIRHAVAALSHVRQAGVVLSDGEHLGIPLALAMATLGIDTPHLVIGHHMSNRRKAPFFRCLRAQSRMDRILVHSPNQIDLLRRRLQVHAGRLHLVPFGIDTSFWRPQGLDEREDLVLAVGREHRDYSTLVEACPESCRLLIAGGSVHSPRARVEAGRVRSSSVIDHVVGQVELRLLYQQAAVVVVPVVQASFPAGITTLLEAMSMGKAVVVSATAGLSGVVDDQRTGLLVDPGDPAEMRNAIGYLLDHPAERQRMGAEARKVAVESHGIDLYARRLAHHLAELAATGVTVRERA